MNFIESLPYIIGFVARGESGLLMWLLYYVNHPEYWFLICGFAVIVSNLSFMLYYYLGFYVDRFAALHKYGEMFKKRIPAQLIRIPTPFVILIMRFFIGIRNPAAVYLGMKKFSVSQFAVYNFLGSIIWIVLWFGVFDIVRAGAHNFLIQYRTVIYTGYGGLLFLWLAGTVIVNVVRKKPSSFMNF